MRLPTREVTTNKNYVGSNLALTFINRRASVQGNS